MHKIPASRAGDRAGVNLQTSRRPQAGANSTHVVAPVPPMGGPVASTPNHLATNFDVLSSSFFQRCKVLPSPAEVRSQAREQHKANKHWGNKKRSVISEGYADRRPCPAVFESRGLFVKWGCAINISEGQSLHMLNQRFRKHFQAAGTPNARVPVPEIYGWRVDNGQTFIYMELINGQTFEQCWKNMPPEKRLGACEQLKGILGTVRRFKQDPKNIFIGNVVKGPLYDRAIPNKHHVESGPFTSVKEFNDWFASLYNPNGYKDPFRPGLPDQNDIVFTHGDLRQCNIIMSPKYGPIIVDWEQAGWLPVYWEDCKACWGHHPDDPWVEKYLPRFLARHDNTTGDSWSEYASAMD